MKAIIKKEVNVPDVEQNRYSGTYIGQTKEGKRGKIDRHGFGIYIFKDSQVTFHGLWVDDKPIRGYMINKYNNSITKMDYPTRTNWSWSYNYGFEIK